MNKCMDPLISRVILWGKQKGIDNPKNQLNKVIEEVGEIAHEITRDRITDNHALADALGDTLVTIIILSDICGYDISECLEQAYMEISNRKGKTVDGNFIKSETDGGEE